MEEEEECVITDQRGVGHWSRRKEGRACVGEGRVRFFCVDDGRGHGGVDLGDWCGGAEEEGRGDKAIAEEGKLMRLDHRYRFECIFRGLNLCEESGRR